MEIKPIFVPTKPQNMLPTTLPTTNTNAANVPALITGPIVHTYESIILAFLADQPRAGQSSKALYSRTLKYFFCWIEAERERDERERAAALAIDAPTAKRRKKAMPEPVAAPTWETVKDTDFPLITRRVVVAYRDALEKAGKSSLTIGGYLTAIRQLFTFAETQGYINAAKGILTPTREQNFRRRALSETEYRDLMQYAATKGPRERAIITFFAATGCRTIEGARANVGDIQTRGGQCLLYVQGKGKKEKDAFVMLLTTACEAIRAYLRTRKIDLDAPTERQAAEPLFLNVSNNDGGERLTTRTISAIIKNALRAIGLDSRHYTAHSLRHTVGTLILEKGGTLLQAQQTLRHANPATTQIYTRAALERRRIEQSGEAVLEAFLTGVCCKG